MTAPAAASLTPAAIRSQLREMRFLDGLTDGDLHFLSGRVEPTTCEHDLLGKRDVPDDALYGIQTLRALENFPITGVPLREFPRLIEALAAVKEAAALANTELGLLDATVSEAIVRAAREVRTGRHHE